LKKSVRTHDRRKEESYISLFKHPNERRTSTSRLFWVLWVARNRKKKRQFKGTGIEKMTEKTEKGPNPMGQASARPIQKIETGCGVGWRGVYSWGKIA